MKLGVNWVTYISVISAIILIIKLIIAKRFIVTRYAILMSIILIIHWLISTDKFSTLLLMVTTLYLYEGINSKQFNYKIIIYPFIALFLFSFIITFPELLKSIKIAHSDRSNLYKGIFLNSNSYAAFCLMVLMSLILFFRTTKKRNILIFMVLISIYSTGSRNAMLFVIISILFYLNHKTKCAKFTFLYFILFLVISSIYLIYFELNSGFDFDIMGKAANSAGRSEQIIYVINNFSVRIFGCGKDVIDNHLSLYGDYSIHNFYVNSLYALGILPLFGYFYYIYTLWKSNLSIIAKSFILSFNVYFFFEPGTCYYWAFINVMPIIILQLHGKEFNVFRNN